MINTIKKLSGFLWIALAFLAIYLMLDRAGLEIAQAVKDQKAVLDTRMFWYIVIPIFTPIMIGLGLFGWYAWKGAYDKIGKPL